MTLRQHPDEIVAASTSPLLQVAPWWERVRLGDIADVINGAAFQSSLFNNAQRGEPLVRIRDVGGTCAQVHYDGPYEKRHVIEHGDLLVGMDGDFRTARWGGSRALMNQRVCRVAVADRELYSEQFLAYVLPPYLDAVHAVTSSTTVKHLSSRSIKDLPVPLPPRAEQERVVAAVEEHLPRLDAAAKALGSAQTRLDALRTRLVGSVLGLSGAPALDDDAPKVPLPDEWRWVRAAEACEMVSSGSTPKAADLFSEAGDVPFIKVYNLGFDGTLDFTIRPTYVARSTHEKQLRRSRLQPNDVLINIVGPPLGKVSIVPDSRPEWNMNQAVAAFRPGPCLNSDFLAYLLMDRSVVEPLLRTGKATAGQINLNISACRRLWLPLPPLAAQEDIVMMLDGATSSWVAAQGQVRGASHRSGALRRSILAAAFSGQLVPQDPVDEPASVLLARIQAVRTEATPAKRTRRTEES